MAFIEKRSYKIKICTNCKELAEHTSKATWCRVCTRTYGKQYNLKNKEAHHIRNQNRYSHEYQREFKLKKRYGMTILDYNILLEKQNYTCAICKSEDSRGHNENFHVDHCHTTNTIRGLLCTKCNMGLGHFDDDISKLINAISYLNKYNT